MPESGLGFFGSASNSPSESDEASSAGEGVGSERNASSSRIEEGGVGGQAEKQCCALGTPGHDVVESRRFSTDDSETVEDEESMEEGTLSASEI